MILEKLVREKVINVLVKKEWKTQIAIDSSPSPTTNKQITSCNKYGNRESRNIGDLLKEGPAAVKSLRAPHSSPDRKFFGFGIQSHYGGKA